MINRFTTEEKIILAHEEFIPAEDWLELIDEVFEDLPESLRVIAVHDALCDIVEEVKERLGR